MIYRGPGFLESYEGGGGGRGAESYDLKKAWPSINRSVLSAKKPPFQCKKGTLRQVFIRVENGDKASHVGNCDPDI